MNAVVVAPHEPSARRPKPRRSRSRARRWRLALAGLALFSITAGSIYYVSSRHAGRSAVDAAPADTPVRALSADRVQRMVDEVKQRVEKDPKDSSAWALLAHSYDMQGRFDESTKAYARLAELLPDNAQVLADYADAQAVAQGRSFKGEPEKLLKRALALDPKNMKALLLAGTEAFDRGAYAEAIAHWDHARAVTTDPAVTRQIESGLAEARALAARGTASAGAPRTAAATAAGRDVSGRVSLSPALQGKVSPDDTVFVFARSTLGSRMPVALLRKKVRDLPLDFRLDDTMAMVPEMKLSALSGVVVGARVSKRGDATPQSGDLQGLTAPVAVGSRNVQVEIGEVLP